MEPEAVCAAEFRSSNLSGPPQLDVPGLPSRGLHTVNLRGLKAITVRSRNEDAQRLLNWAQKVVQPAVRYAEEAVVKEAPRQVPLALAPVAVNVAGAGGPMMTSREIAELTGKEHKNVLRDIREMLESLTLTSAQFSADVPDVYGRPQPSFSLPKDLTLTLVSGYSIPLRAKIIRRWMELEGKVSAAPAAEPEPSPTSQFERFAVPQTLAEALRLAADLADQVAYLKTQPVLALTWDEGTPVMTVKEWLRETA